MSISWWREQGVVGQHNHARGGMSALLSEVLARPLVVLALGELATKGNARAHAAAAISKYAPSRALDAATAQAYQHGDTVGRQMGVSLHEDGARAAGLAPDETHGQHVPTRVHHEARKVQPAYAQGTCGVSNACTRPAAAGCTHMPGQMPLQGTKGLESASLDLRAASPPPACTTLPLSRAGPHMLAARTHLRRVHLQLGHVEPEPATMQLDAVGVKKHGCSRNGSGSGGRRGCTNLKLYGRRISASQCTNEPVQAASWAVKKSSEAARMTNSNAWAICATTVVLCCCTGSTGPVQFVMEHCGRALSSIARRAGRAVRTKKREVHN